MSWRDLAACLGVDTELFFPKYESDEAAEPAKEICGGCKVSAECLEYALRMRPTDDAGGVWAGLTHRERMNLRKRRWKERRDVA